MYEIDYIRALGGYALASIFAATAISMTLTGFRMPPILIGLLLALFVGMILVYPVFVLVKRMGWLKIWWAVPLGGLAAASPFSTLHLLTKAPISPGVAIIAMTMFAYGAIGALIGWVFTFGLRVEPPRKKSDR